MKEVFMTTRQYLDKLEQNEIDELFDKAIKEANERHMKELASKEHERFVQSLIQKLADYEAELDCLQQMYRNMFESKDTPKEDLISIKNEIKSMKMRYTKIKNELDNVILQENQQELKE